MHIVSPNGTADRFEWWTTTLVCDVTAQLAALLGMFYWSSNESYGIPVGSLFLLLAAISLWISIAVTFRRLRDRGRPLWAFVFGLTPIIGWLWMLIECGFMASAYRGPQRILARRTVTAKETKKAE